MSDRPNAPESPPFQPAADAQNIPMAPGRRQFLLRDPRHRLRRQYAARGTTVDVSTVTSGLAAVAVVDFEASWATLLAAH